MGLESCRPLRAAPVGVSISAPLELALRVHRRLIIEECVWLLRIWLPVLV